MPLKADDVLYTTLPDESATLSHDQYKRAVELVVHLTDSTGMVPMPPAATETLLVTVLSRT